MGAAGTDPTGAGAWSAAWGWAASPAVFDLVAVDHRQSVAAPAPADAEGLRVRFWNAGRTPLELDGVAVEVLGDAGPAEPVPVLLDGARQVRLDPGERRVGDAVALRVRRGDRIRVTTSTAGSQPVTTGSLSFAPAPLTVSTEGSLELPPEAAAMMAAMDLPETEVASLYGVAGVDLLGTSRVPTVVAFGDSIVQMGYWTGPLHRRLLTQGATLVNAGISGNRLLHDAPRVAPQTLAYGEAGVRRFERDVLGGAPVDAVILSIGVNDLCHPVLLPGSEAETVTAEQIGDGLAALARTAHEHGARAVAATLMPFSGYPAWSPGLEAVRREVNDRIRSDGVFDAVLDFEAAVSDRADPPALADGLHIGDHLHPGPDGGARIAAAVDPSVLV